MKRRGYYCLTLGLLFSLVACGGGGASGGGPIVLPSPVPTGVPRSPLSVSPNPVNVTGTGAGSATKIAVQESGYSGAFTESDTCSGIAAIAAPSNLNGPSVTFTAEGIAAGTCSASFTDSNAQKASTSVVVTTGGIIISSAPVPHTRKDR